MVTGAPLENARHLAQRYDKIRQEAEAQVLKIIFFFDELKISLLKIKRVGIAQVQM